MSRLTDSFRTLKVFNSAGFYGDQPYIRYVAQDLGPGGGGASWRVFKRGEALGSHWLDGSAKVFSLFLEGTTHAERKRNALVKAQEFASKRFGITEWAKDPYGGYGPAEFVKTRTTELKKKAGPGPEYKVYGGTGFVQKFSKAGRSQCRVVVAAKSWTAAMRAVEAAGLFKPQKNHWGETANEEELSVALAQPNTVFARLLDDRSGEYAVVHK